MASERIKIYDCFRGVDLSEDQSVVSENHSPEMVNMYKDYGTSKGRAIETIRGFRRRFSVDDKPVTDFFFFSKKTNENTIVLPIVHVGEKLYLWSNYPESLGITEKDEKAIALDGKITFSPVVDELCAVFVDGTKVDFSYDKTSGVAALPTSFAEKKALVKYKKKTAGVNDVLFDGVSTKRLTYFAFGGKLYILDGEKYLVYDGESVCKVEPYIPTTYIGITASSIGSKLDEKNVLTDSFYNTFAADGKTTEFFLSEKNLSEISSVELYGVLTTEYSVDLENGKITFPTPPKSGIDEGFEDGYAGIRVLAKGSPSTTRKSLLSARHAKAFEGAVILAGSEDFGGIYYSAVDAPDYFPEINYAYIGGGVGEVTGLTVCGNELFAYFFSTDGGGIYRVKSLDTGVDDNPQVFAGELVSSTEKLVYAGLDFVDLPTFLTENGVFALASPNLKLERVVEKRSGLIDSELRTKDLKNARLFSFDGYFCVYVQGVVYMGDSRQVYRNEKGEDEFEWFKLEDVGSYSGAYERYVFSPPTEGVPSEYFAPTEFIGETANPPESDGTPSRSVLQKTENGKSFEVVLQKTLVPTIRGEEIAYEEKISELVVKKCDEKIGGVFEEALELVSFDGNVFFSTAQGLFSFNFDLDKNDRKAYDFDGRTICSRVATRLDNLGYPDMKKSSIAKSLVIKLGAADNSNLTVMTRTDATNYRKIGEINVGRFDFSKLDFSSTSFNTSSCRAFVLNDREKGFLEKQVALYSDKYQSPFCLHYLSYRYRLAGKLKNKRST